jgi:DNA-binding beta-propeller fold protein YncE
MKSLSLFPRLVLGAALTASALAESHYEALTEISIPGEGGWDYLSVDSATHRLFVTHATKVVVIDTQTDKIVGEISDTPGVHGFAIAPDLGRGFSSNGRENKVNVVDLATLKTLSKIETGANPDAILYESANQEVYTFNGSGQSATVIAAKTGKVVATIPLGAKPEFAQEDAAVGHIFVNLEDKSQVVVIDAKTHAVLSTWPIAPGEEPTGMDIDLVHHRLFLGCGNAQIAVLNDESGEVVASIPAGKGIDAAVFDAGTQLVFASNGADGTVTIAHEDTPDKFTVVQTLKTERSARTMIIDLATHKMYLVSANFGPAVPGSRPPMVPGSMKVLVYGLKI